MAVLVFKTFVDLQLIVSFPIVGEEGDRKARERRYSARRVSVQPQSATDLGKVQRSDVKQVVKISGRET